MGEIDDVVALISMERDGCYIPPPIVRRRLDTLYVKELRRETFYRWVAFTNDENLNRVEISFDTFQRVWVRIFYSKGFPYKVWECRHIDKIPPSIEDMCELTRVSQEDIPLDGGEK